jgi:hypothetical protein
MKFTYTAGEWTVTELRRGDYDVPRDQWEHVLAITSSARPGVTLCEVLVPAPALQLEEARANARLAAAGPQLVRALAVIATDQRIRALLEANDPKALEQAEAALAAAGVTIEAVR